MDKQELHIIALTKSQSSEGEYVIVLEEKDGSRRIPILIGAFEAQAIALALDEHQTPRPMSHDLMLTLLQRENGKLKEVLIDSYEDNMFSAQLIISSPGKEESIDARSSDAIALALRQPCHIFTYNHILEEAGMILDNAGKFLGEEERLDQYSIEELEVLLNTCLEQEDYQRAQKIRDLIDRKR